MSTASSLKTFKYTQRIIDEYIGRAGWRYFSIAKGLVPPNDEAICSHKTTTPSLHELELASRPHRWSEMRKLHKEMFNSFMREVTEVEENLLDILNLPGIEEVRESVISQRDQDITGTAAFAYTDSMDKKVVKEFKEWQDELVGSKVIKPMEATYPYWMLQAFSIGLKKTWQQIRSEQKQPDDIPDTSNPYLIAAIKNGGDRIKTKLGRTYLLRLRKELKRMSREGINPMIVGRSLHKNIGEGQAWYWNRITRSESGLAVNGAFNANAKKYNVPYERWSAAPTACAICSYFDGRIWRVGSGPEPVSDTHPHCTISSTKTYTLEGWKSIKDIKLNELVLSHVGKFRRVTKLHKHKEKNQKMVRVSYLNDPYTNTKSVNKPVSIVFTDNHPMLVNGQWLSAGKIEEGDKIRLLATQCRECGKVIPFSRWRNGCGEKSNYCSQTCCTSATQKKYGSKYLLSKFREKGREIIEAGNHHFQKGNVTFKKWIYKSKNETVKIRAKISKHKKKHNPMFSDSTRQKMIASLLVINKDPKRRKALSMARQKFIKENPGFCKKVIAEWKKRDPKGYKKAKLQQAKTLKRFWQEHPEKHPNRTMKNVSKNQRKLYELINADYKNVELEYPIKTKNGTRYGDVVLIDYKLVLEYDGDYWHRDKAKDSQRDKELFEQGWDTLRFTKNDWQDAPLQVERLLMNHSGEYEFIDVVVSGVEQYEKESIILYNLSVDQDESYVAKGFVVHNCLCNRGPYYDTLGQTIEEPWRRATPYDVPYTADEWEWLRRAA